MWAHAHRWSLLSFPSPFPSPFPEPRIPEPRRARISGLLKARGGVCQATEGPRGAQQLGTEPYGPIACPCPSHKDPRIPVGRPCSHRAARGPYIGPEDVEGRLHIRSLLLLERVRVLLVALFLARARPLRPWRPRRCLRLSPSASCRRWATRRRAPSLDSSGARATTRPSSARHATSQRSSLESRCVRMSARRERERENTHASTRIDEGELHTRAHADAPHRMSSTSMQPRISSELGGDLGGRGGLLLLRSRALSLARSCARARSFLRTRSRARLRFSFGTLIRVRQSFARSGTTAALCARVLPGLRKRACAL